MSADARDFSSPSFKGGASKSLEGETKDDKGHVSRKYYLHTHDFSLSRHQISNFTIETEKLLRYCASFWMHKHQNV